jgi:uncharacterized protein involved in type VI secretion and phage assembly
LWTDGSVDEPRGLTTMSTTDDGETVAGVRLATVRDNEDPESLGRVQVTYPWSDSDEAYWARIATEMTGDEYGTYFLPEVGDEVLVGFEAGDRRQPYVVGSLWTPDRTPPEENGGNNDIKAVETRAGHRIEFDDGGEGGVTVETKAGHEVVLDDTAGAETIRIEDAGGNSVELNTPEDTVTISAGNTISLEAPNIELDADARVEVSADGRLSIETGGTGRLESSGPLQLRGALIQLN